SLRGSARIGKVDGNIILITDAPPVGELFATVECDGLEQVFRHSLKPVVHSSFDMLRLPAFRLQRNDDFGKTLYERNHCAFVMGAHNGISFKVTEFIVELRMIRFSFRNISCK